MRRVFTALTLGLLTLIMTVAPSLAGVTWCRADPIISLDGTEVQIWVAIPPEYERFVNGPIDVRIKVPREIQDRKVLHLDEGFNGHGERVTFGTLRRASVSDGVIPIEIDVKLSLDRRELRRAFGNNVVVPVQVEIVQGGQSEYVYGTHRSMKYQFSVTATAVEEE